MEPEQKSVEGKESVGARTINSAEDEYTKEEMELWARWADEYPLKTNQDLNTAFKMGEAKARADERRRVGEEVEKLRPETTCNCVGGDYNCEHWGIHETVDSVLEIIKGEEI